MHPFNPGLGPYIALPVVFQHLIHDPAIGIGDDKPQISMPIGLIGDRIDDPADPCQGFRNDWLGMAYLFCHDHLLAVDDLARAHLIDVHTTGDGLVFEIASIPGDLVITGQGVIHPEGFDELAFEVVDADLHRPWCFEAIAQSGAGIEGIGIGVQQSCGNRDGGGNGILGGIIETEYLRTKELGVSTHIHAFQPVII